MSKRNRHYAVAQIPVDKPYDEDYTAFDEQVRREELEFEFHWASEHPDEDYLGRP